MTIFRPLANPAVVEIVPPRIEDHRGFFSEIYQRIAFSAAGVDADWIQDSHTFSALPGTVRGLHFQLPPLTQAKLVRVTRGAIFDVAVDLRRGSPHYGQWVGLEVSAERWNQVFVPAGFAHGFMTTRPNTEVQYKIDAPWSREHERAIHWDDPVIGVAWPDDFAAIFSTRDAQAPALADFDTPFIYKAEAA